MIEINGRGKTNRRLFADDFLSTVFYYFCWHGHLLFLVVFNWISDQVKTTDQEEAELSTHI